jgi:signal transduction histidine kinase
MLNAAKFAGDGAVSVFAELSPEHIVVFVRDRGPGFDLAAVPDQRRGVRESIIGRMRRAGGRAVVRSTAAGTEIELALERGGRA